MVRSDLHLGEFERVVTSSEEKPFDALGVDAGVTGQVETVQVTLMAHSIPPAAFVFLRARRVRFRVVVTVFGGEQRAHVIFQRVTCAQTIQVRRRRS